MSRIPSDGLPDVRDGLNRVERVILYQLHELQKERRDVMSPLPNSMVES